MSLDHAILGFLKYRSLSGYDLKSVFDLSVQHFWPADQSQIYRTLSRLTESGMLDVEVIEQDDRPDRKVYNITEKGEEELHRWLTTPLPPKDRRIAELVQVFFAGQMTDEEITTMFRRFVENSRRALDTLNQVPNDACDVECCAEAEARDAFFWGLTLEYGIRMTEASLAWAEDVMARMERGEHVKATER